MGTFSFIEDNLGDVGSFISNPVNTILDRSGIGFGTGAVAAIPGVAGYIAAEEGRKSDERMNEQNLAFAREQFDYQKHANENSLQMRIADGLKAGLHPLAAIGAAPGGGVSPVGMSQVPTQSSLGNLALAGQDFSRALMAQQTTEEKMITALTLENMALQNKHLMAQTGLLEQQMRNQPSVPGTPSLLPGQANGLAVVDKPLERTASIPGHGAQEAGVISDYGYTMMNNGNLAIRPGTEQKQAMEDDFIAEGDWHLRNRISQPRYPKEYDPGRGNYWHWVPLFGQWQPRSMKVIKHDYNPPEGVEYEMYFRKRKGGK